MNKLYGGGPKGEVLVCILEPGNLQRLKENKPIDIDLNDGPWKNHLQRKFHVVIAYSETPVADARKFVRDFPEMRIEDRRTEVSESKRPHCPECKSTVEQLAVWRSDESPLWLAFCATCGCIFRVSRQIEGLEPKQLSAGSEK